MADDDATRDSLCGFPPVTIDAWRELATRELGGASTQKLVTRTAEGLELTPLVTAEDAGAAVPRAPLLARGRRGWAIAQEYRQAAAKIAGAAAAEDLSHGTEAAWFVLDEAIAAGLTGGAHDGHGRGTGVVVAGAADVAALVAGIDLAQAEVVIDAGARALPVAAALVAEAQRRGVAPGQLRGAVAGDPLALLLATGELGWPIEHVYEDMAELTGWARAHAPGLRTALVDATPWHEAGASAADEVAGALAAALEHLRGLQAAGVTVDAAAGALVFVLAVGRDLALELAKLRAARSLWARVAAACGVGPEGQVMRLHARASRRELSNLDPWVNLIRATTEGVTAALAGADSIALPSLDEGLGEPSTLGRRLARNTQLLLRDESHLGAVTDPAGGSHTIERATDALARAAWTRLQAIEREGGLLASLRAGAAQGRVAAQAQAQAQAAATLRLPIVGASRYATRPMGPPLGAKVPAASDSSGATAGGAAVREVLSQATWSEGHAFKSMSEVQAAFTGARGLGGFRRPGPGPRATPLARGRLAGPFEALRARGAALGEPRVALVPLGTASEVRPRVEYARAYFPVGGFEVVEVEATEELQVAAARFANSGARVAVICGTDARYAAAVPELVPGLRAAGAHVIVLAGRPKDSWEALAAAGVDVFIAAGADALAALGAVQERLEVLA
ncbi:methylmalonyl-CoA mutase family protein [Nannocystis bainbridge]|uniref:Methylmalonyl-CoA mutase family protein n=1 Tax=Nannocystis bainbridge TaxID=2995303 RepID=A0ABT5DX57_9BACT|nr:methylmalonyl-CoA mutase family protein [Nannocystis bainbridge]MDC0718214.1 methylmalonyl-CoA mutase family protein [Nannocystis bainbridge]